MLHPQTVFTRLPRNTESWVAPCLLGAVRNSWVLHRIVKPRYTIHHELLLLGDGVGGEGLGVAGLLLYRGVPLSNGPSRAGWCWMTSRGILVDESGPSTCKEFASFFCTNPGCTFEGAHHVPRILTASLGGSVPLPLLWFF